MAVITDDHFTPDEKLAEYNRVLVGYKFNLRRRSDLTKALLFIRMLDDNAAQFLDVFVEGVAEAEEQGQTFDFSRAISIPSEVAILTEIGDELKYRLWLPVYSMRAACGKFGAQEAVEPEGWVQIQVAGPFRPRTNRYVVRASGRSMEDKIHDGQLCVFEFREGTCDEDDIVLAQHADIQDDDTDGAYTIKKFTSEREGGGV